MNTADSQSPFVAINQARSYLAGKVIGQAALIDRLIMALLCGGHLLVFLGGNIFVRLAIIFLL